MSGQRARHRHGLTAVVGLVIGTVLVGVSSPAPTVQAGDGNQGTYGAREQGMFLEYQVTGLDVGAPFQGWADATVTSATVTVSGTAFAACGETCVTRPSIALDIGNGAERVQSYAWPPDDLRDAEGYVHGPFAQEEPFSFTHTIVAGDNQVAIHLSVSMVNGASDLLGVTIFAPITPDTTIPGVGGTSTTTAPEGSPSTTAPAGSVVISGTVTVPTGTTGTEQPTTLPIAAAPLRAMSAGAILAATIVEPNGSYRVEVPARTRDLQLEVELRNGDFVRVVDDQATDAATVATKPFDVGDDPKTIDVVLDPSRGVTGTNFPTQHVLGAGRVYAYLYEAWYEAAINLGITLDFNLPLDAKVYSTEVIEGATAPSTYARISVYPGDNITDPYVNYHAAVFDDPSALQFVVIHEFGHFVQTDLQGNLFPHDPANTYHQGYANPSTTDSWTEGFATFFVLLVGRDVEGDIRPLLGYYDGGELDFDLAYYFPWDQTGGVGIAEEMAVAGMLWDLVDDWQNATPLEASAAYLTEVGVVFRGTALVEQMMRPYMDRVQVGAQELMMVLSGDYSHSDASPVTTQEGWPAYRGVFDLQQLHSVLVAQGAGQTLDVGYPDLTALDAVFISHGMFADTSPPNLFWDVGEQVGTVRHVAMTISGEALVDRSLRRTPPPLPDSAVLLTATYVGQPTSVDMYEVRIDIDDTVVEGAGHFDRTYLARPDATGRLTILLPDPVWNATATITPAGNWESDTPLVIDSATYWASINDEVPGPILEHTFTVRATRSGGSNHALGYILVAISAIGIVGFGTALWRRRTTS